LSITFASIRFSNLVTCQKPQFLPLFPGVSPCVARGEKVRVGIVHCLRKQGCTTAFRVLNNRVSLKPVRVERSSSTRMTSSLSPRESFRASLLSPEINTIIDEFARQLTEVAERAAAEQSQQLLHEAFAALQAEEQQPERQQRQRWLEDLTQQMVAAIAQIMQVAGNDQVRNELFRRAKQAEKDPSQPSGIVRRRARRKPVRPAPPPLDPEQIKRDQEFARLRALLKPVADERPAPAPTPPPVATPPIQVHRPAGPGDILRALEKEIQDAVPTLGTLGPVRCAAQIAAWVGQVRGLRDRLPAEVSATMRPAFRIFLEHLGELRLQMEAHVVDALEQDWKAPDWDVYVEVNRALAEQRPPSVSRDQLQAHYRAMLRALVFSHRRNVPQQALPIIEEAAQVLSPEDNLLQSARRRHRTVTQEQQPRSETAERSSQPEPATPKRAEPAAEAAETETAFPSATDPVQPAQESEFDSPWLK
jgi:hypothetical protein